MATTTCSYCSKSFTARGINSHKRRCKLAPIIPNYKHYLVNDDVFGHILGYLCNQTLAKLQAVTGDQYVQYDAKLIPYACRRCENDNPAIRDGLCTRCHSRRGSYKHYIVKTEAKDLYHIKNFSGIPCTRHRRSILYARTDLDAHMRNLYGSNREWLKAIAVRVARCQALQITREKKEKEIKAYLESLPDGFQEFINPFYVPHKKSTLKEMLDRYVALDNALALRNLRAINESSYCINYIFMGDEPLEDTVNDIEEANFLNTHTDYLDIAHSTVKQFKTIHNHRLNRTEYNFILRLCMEITKRMLCVHHLQVDHGYTLPHKWEMCRDRLNMIISAGIIPDRGIARDYIYDNIGTIEDLI